jgi:hypothetical protein
MTLFRIRLEALGRIFFVLTVTGRVVRRRCDLPVSSTLLHKGRTILLNLSEGALLDGTIVQRDRIRRAVLHAYLFRTVAPHHDIDWVVDLPSLLEHRQLVKLDGKAV